MSDSAFAVTWAWYLAVWAVLSASSISLAVEMAALRARNCDVAYVELLSNYGHDSFLVDVAEQADMVRGFLASTFEKVQ